MIIGLIGGIGSGKSTVSAYLKSKYKFTILIADDIVKDMEKPGHRLYEKLVDAFGERILTGGDTGRPIDRAAFADIIYYDKAALNRANAIIHPVAWKYIAQKTALPGDYVVETALPDKVFPDRCDTVWYVWADKKTRIQRLMVSRGYSEKKCKSIIKNQLKVIEFKKLSDELIKNNGDTLSLYGQIDKIMEGLRRGTLESS